MSADTRSDAELVLAVRGGERDAFAELVDRWFDRCAEVAWRILHDRGRAAEVTQESLLTAWQQLDRLRDPEAFGGWLLRSTRNRALDRLARERRVVSTGEERELEAGGGAPSAAPELLGTPDAEVDRRATSDLVWAAAAALGPRDASLLDLHLRHGLQPGELAGELGITPNAAHQAMFRLRSRLGAAITAYLVWRDGDPRCVVLAAELAAAGSVRFGPEVVAVVQAHLDVCVSCGEERARVTAPAAMFSAVPLLLLPAAARAEVFAELARAGVPVPLPVGGTPGVDDPTDDAEVGDTSDPGGDGGGGGTSRAGSTGAGSTGAGTRVAGARVAVPPVADRVLRRSVLVASALLLTLGVGLTVLGSGLLDGDGAELATDAVQDAAAEMGTDPDTVAPAPPGPADDGVVALAPLPAPDTLVPPVPPSEAGSVTDDLGAAAGDAVGERTDPGSAPGGDGDGAAPSRPPPAPTDSSVERPVDGPGDEPIDREPPSETPDPPPASPSITRFSLVAGSVCVLQAGAAPGRIHEATWAVEAATEVTLTARGATEQVGATGTRTLCLADDDEVQLVATGEGGDRVVSVVPAEPF